MTEILVLIVGYFTYRSMNAKLVVEAGDNMPSYIRNALYNAGYLPYEIPIQTITSQMVMHKTENLLTGWFDVYVK